MLKKTSRSGFTLIELLVVMSITVILSLIGIVAYNEFNRKQILDQAVRGFKINLRLAQNKAITGEKDCRSLSESATACGGSTSGCGNDTNGTERSLTGWVVTLGANSYSLSGDCSTTFSSVTYNLPTNVTLSSSASYLKFRPMYLGASSDVAFPFTITLTAFGQSQNITVSQSGDVN